MTDSEIKKDSYWIETGGSDDICFCYSDCVRTDCGRHQSHAPKNHPYSMGWLSEACREYTEEKHGS